MAAKSPKSRVATKFDVMSTNPNTALMGAEHPARLHWWTRILVGLVWPLIWVGGLVTTYDAGMSVPDWPNTYGYNLFLYPYQTWLYGPFDLFIEHGHRLLASVVGLVAIVVAAIAIGNRSGAVSRGVRVLSAVVLLMVIAQGILGGLRVVWSERSLALVHGCFGPSFFVACVALMVATGRWWHGIHPGDHRSDQVLDGSDVTRDSTDATVNNESPERLRPSRFLLGSLAAVLVLGMSQLVLGAVMRHAPATMTPSAFAAVVGLHVAGAFTLAGVAVVNAWRVCRVSRRDGVTRSGLRFSAVMMLPLVATQIGLGVVTWIVNYGYTTMWSFLPGDATYLIPTKGFSESILVTAHVATGSLILAVATVLVTRAWRLRGRTRRNIAADAELRVFGTAA